MCQGPAEPAVQANAEGNLRDQKYGEISALVLGKCQRSG